MVDIANIDWAGFAGGAILDGWETTGRHYADFHLAATDRWKRVTFKPMQIKNDSGDCKCSDEGLKKILGPKFLRLFREVLV